MFYKIILKHKERVRAQCPTRRQRGRVTANRKSASALQRNRRSFENQNALQHAFAHSATQVQKLYSDLDISRS